MSDWPNDAGPIPVVLTTLSYQMGAHPAVSVSAFASATWPANNQAIFIPFVLSMPELIVKLFVMNGATASGNIDMGIYDDAGTRIVSIGTTAQTGTSAIQAFDITDTQVGPGRFYLALALSSTVGTVFRLTSATANYASMMGAAEQATAFALPATATFVAPTSSYVPLIGMTTRTVV